MSNESSAVVQEHDIQIEQTGNCIWVNLTYACSAGVLVTAADAFVLLLIEQWGVRQLEAVFGLFIAVMAGAFGIMYSNADIPQREVAKGQHAACCMCFTTATTHVTVLSEIVAFGHAQAAQFAQLTGMLASEPLCRSPMHACQMRVTCLARPSLCNNTQITDFLCRAVAAQATKGCPPPCCGNGGCIDYAS